MPWDPIPKDPRSFRVRPHLDDYEEVCRRFSWREAESELEQVWQRADVSPPGAMF